MDLEELKRQKMEELQKRQLEEQAEAKIKSAVRSLLTEEALQRLNNVGLVNKELYLKAVQVVLQLRHGGQMQDKLGEEELKLLLDRLRNKREISIKRK